MPGTVGRCWNIPTQRNGPNPEELTVTGCWYVLTNVGEYDEFAFCKLADLLVARDFLVWRESQPGTSSPPFTLIE